MDFFGATGEMSSTAVPEIVPGNRCDDHILKAHGAYGVRQLRRLSGIQRRRAAMSYITEGASAGTDIPHDHEGRGTTIEALPKVGTIRLLANRMQVMITQNPCQPADLGRSRRLGPDPGRFGQTALPAGFRPGGFFGASFFLTNFHNRAPFLSGAASPVPHRYKPAAPVLLERFLSSLKKRGGPPAGVH
jgi:hypothetical protein